MFLTEGYSLQLSEKRLHFQMTGDDIVNCIQLHASRPLSRGDSLTDIVGEGEMLVQMVFWSRRWCVEFRQSYI